MNSLAQLQNEFQQFILTGESAIIDSIISTEQVPAKTRLAIYHDGYYIRLTECLTVNFPTLYLYLGTAEFNTMSRCYIDAHASSFRSIRWYGDSLSAFLAQYYDKPYVFLAELADFEWKMTLAFDAADAPALSIEEMAAVPPDAWVELSFKLHPSVQRVHYMWNTVPLWQALSADKEIPLMDSESDGKSWLLWRAQDDVVQFCSLSKEEAWMLDGIKQGLTFAALCEGLCQWIDADKVAMTAASYLKNWIQKGILSQLEF
jgi:hypothetical protein